MSAPGKINDEVVIAGLLPALTESTVNEKTKTKTWFESVGINPKTFREQAWVLNGLYWFMSDGFRVGVRDGSFGGLDYQTNVGGSDFWKEHIGDAYETGVSMLVFRGLIEGVDYLRQKNGKDKMDPRVKMWVSVLAGMAWPIIAETTGMRVGGWNSPDPLDSFGPIVAGVLAGSTWELITFLGDGEKVAAAKDRIGNAATSLKPNAEMLTSTLSETPDKLRKLITQHFSDIDASIDYITQEGKISFLMLLDMFKKKERPVEE